MTVREIAKPMSYDAGAGPPDDLPCFPCQIYCWTCRTGRWFVDIPNRKLRCRVCTDPYRLQYGGQIVEPPGAPREDEYASEIEQLQNGGDRSGRM